MNRTKFATLMAYLLPVIFMLLGPLSSVDLFGWIADGLAILKTFSVNHGELFSILPTKENIAPNWGLSLVYGIFYKFFGLVGVYGFHYFILLIVLHLIYKKTFLQLNSPWSAPNRMILYLFFLGLTPQLIERPSLISLLGFVIAFFILFKQEQVSLTARDVMLLSLLMVVWVNGHGSFILILVLYLYRLIFRAIFFKKIESIDLWGFLFIFLSSLVNPFGVKTYDYILETTILSKERHISEWQNLSLIQHQSLFLTFATIVLLYLVVMIRKRKSGKKLSELLHNPIGFFLLINPFSVRTISYSVLMLLPFLFSQGLIKEGGEVASDGPKKWRVAIIGLFVVFAIMLLPPFKKNITNLLPESRKSIFEEDTLWDMAARINHDKKSCPIFNDWEYGSFLRLTVSNKIFIDQRNIIYSKDVYNSNQDVLSGRSIGWQQYLDYYGACLAILSPLRNDLLIKKMIRSGKWKVIFVEKNAFLLSRI